MWIDTTRFNLKLGALIEAVIPQPVIRHPDGTLRQNRDEIVVYFNEDPMFVENDESGNPTIRSVAKIPWKLYAISVTPAVTSAA